ncbi:MAG TPA: leucyl aminopeptidase [bacterium]|nr:leucyl aminopeptidase [bacterium]
MRFTTKSPSASVSTIDLLGLAIASKGLATSFGRDIDRKLGGTLSRIIKTEELKGKAGETRSVSTLGKIPAANVLLIGLGDPSDGPQAAETLRKAAARLVKNGNRLRAKTVALEDADPCRKKAAAPLRGQAVAEGAVLASYSFDVYKKPNAKKTVQNIVVLTPDATRVAAGFRKGTIYAESTNFARDLINLPANDMTPRRMVQEARNVAQKAARGSGLRLKILGEREIRRLGMGCYWAVSRGSVEPPALIHLHYRPKSRPRKKIAIVGKGVTFDSGGLSLKTAQGMETMKDDMSGSAAMLAVMKAVSALKPNVEIHGFAAMTENMPSGSAGKPGDIVRAMNGKSVEILNTDAEGRLTLADAVAYAQKQKPDLLIDVATLTGACVIALGELCSGILGNNQVLIDRLILAAKAAGEKVWQLPLIEEYKDELKSSAADLKNVGGRWGGTINGALFIQEFIDAKLPWAHIDIAGPSWTEKELDFGPRGGTGHIVRTLLEFIDSIQTAPIKL